ncbi:MAG: hypothetical protein KJ710_06865 [Candidatus Omnitrophica bacterium]|nr:hypothetical protein [Candidatus Omnitrophota bacterium]MBU1923956.1 hypothetical protein [Candidatus Omnitrophota bacterium]
MSRKRKGLALIAAIMLMVFVSIAVLGLSVFIVGWYGQIDTAERGGRCIYNSAAGVHYALYQYRNSAVLTSGTFTIDANNNFTVSTTPDAASSLVIDATGSSLASANRNLQGVTLTNSSSSAIIIDRIIVTWIGASRTLQTIRIGNSNVWATDVSLSPADCNIDDTAISAGDTVNLTRIRWNSSMSGLTITLQFVMTDGSISSVCTAYPSPGSTCTTAAVALTIKSMGKTTGSNQYRSVEAAYNIATGNVSDYDEINQVVP